jgi:hypothetical protein
MRIGSQKDFVAGLMFSVLGIAFAVGATSYHVGEGARMGPGYFPLMLGTLLAVMGAGVAAIGVAAKPEEDDDGRIGSWAWKPLIFVIGANLIFGLLLGGLPSVGVPAMGLIAAIYGLTIIASLAGDQFRMRDVLLLATALAIGSYIAFVVLLKLQFQVWPTFITG